MSFEVYQPRANSLYIPMGGSTSCLGISLTRCGNNHLMNHRMHNSSHFTLDPAVYSIDAIYAIYPIDDFIYLPLLNLTLKIGLWLPLHQNGQRSL